MPEDQDVTPEVVIADLQQHFGEWVIRSCHHKGDKGLLIQTMSGELFVVTVSQVRGVIIT